MAIYKSVILRLLIVMHLFILPACGAIFDCDSIVGGVGDCTSEPKIIETSSIHYGPVVSDGTEISVRIGEVVLEYWTRNWKSSSRYMKYHVIYDIEVKRPSGSVKRYRRIDTQKGPRFLPVFFMVDRISVGTDGVVMEYRVIPSDAENAISKGYPRTLKKYARNGRVDRWTKAKHLGPFNGRKSHKWVEISKDEFHRQAETGPVVDIKNLNKKNMRFLTVHTNRNINIATHKLEELEEKKKSFLEEIKNNNLGAVRLLLVDNRWLWGVTNFEDTTVLHMAVKSGSFNMLGYIFSYQPHVINTVNVKGQTPLHLAVVMGADKKVIDYLAARGGRILFPEQGLDQGHEIMQNRNDIVPSHLIDKLDCNKEGWLGQHAYGLWVSDKRPNLRLAAISNFIKELDLEGINDRTVSTTAQKLQKAMKNSRILCETGQKTGGRAKYYWAIFHPELKGLVEEYQRQKKY